MHVYLLHQGSRGDRGESGLKGDKVSFFSSGALAQEKPFKVKYICSLNSILRPRPQGAMGFPGMLGQKVRKTVFTQF